MSSAPPFAIDVADFWLDPYPALAQMRSKAPIAFVPQFGATLFTRHDDICALEKRTDVLSAHQPAGLMNRLMGHNMMRKDGKAHMAERTVFQSAISPKTVRAHWQAEFQVHADRILDEIEDLGRADLVASFAMPFSGECLKSMTGLTNIQAWEMDAWSQAMINGIVNFTGDLGTEAICHTATLAIDAAIDEMLGMVKKSPSLSLLSVMWHAGMPEQSIRANIKLTISGGQNEPRKAISGCIWALLTHPEQFDLVRTGKAEWSQVFEEYLRWISPIGMSPRRVARPCEFKGIKLAPEDRVFLMFGSANRDEEHFVDASRFDITRRIGKNIAFGAGPHFCAGAAAARTMAVDVALPSVFARLKGLRPDLSEPVRFGGWAFRGLFNLPVIWDV